MWRINFNKRQGEDWDLKLSLLNFWCMKYCSKYMWHVFFLNLYMKQDQDTPLVPYGVKFSHFSRVPAQILWCTNWLMYQQYHVQWHRMEQCLNPCQPGHGASLKGLRHEAQRLSDWAPILVLAVTLFFVNSKDQQRTSTLKSCSYQLDKL